MNLAVKGAIQLIITFCVIPFIGAIIWEYTADKILPTPKGHKKTAH